jgi:polyhydroxyalkanoate synthase subunit PhaE
MMSDREPPRDTAATPANLFAMGAKAWETAGAEGGPFELASQSLDPRRWLGVSWGALEQPFEKLLGLPRFAAFPALDRKAVSLLAGWLQLAQRSGAYSAIVWQVWAEAYVDFIRGLCREAAEQRPVGVGRELLDRWTAAINEKLLTAQRGDGFLGAQRQMLDALLTSRTRERELVEMVAQIFDLPTRSEVDDVHRSLHEAKREIRRLRRRLDAVEGVSTKSKAARPAEAARSARRNSKDGAGDGVSPAG